MTSMIGFKHRGLRNNNPFNIKKSHFKWVGKKSQSSDPVFEQFDNMYYGLRAGMKLLVYYVNKGFNTPRKIIYRFAPESENKSELYLDFVCHSRGVWINPDVPITSIEVLCNLASNMIIFENGINLNTLTNIKAQPCDLFDLCNFYKFNLKK